jgi:hypothetical protein
MLPSFGGSSWDTEICRMPVERFLLELVIILAAAKIGSEIAERLNQPAVLGGFCAGTVTGIPLFGRCAAVPALPRPSHTPSCLKPVSSRYLTAPGSGRTDACLSPHTPAEVQA